MTRRDLRTLLLQNKMKTLLLSVAHDRDKAQLQSNS